MTSFYQKNIQNILAKVNRLNKTKFVIGIDGAGGAGKSTLANELIEKLPGTIIIHMDDFYKQKVLRKLSNSTEEIGAYFDWKRLESQVLVPFKNNEEIIYQKYDWQSDSILPDPYVVKESNLIIEGVYSTRLELAGYYDLKIWIDCPYETRLQRGIERDGREMKVYWQNVWQKQEDEYIATHNAFSNADFIIYS